MQQSLVLSIGLPVVLFVIMLGLGLSLRIEDFVLPFPAMADRGRPRLPVGDPAGVLLRPGLSRQTAAGDQRWHDAASLQAPAERRPPSSLISRAATSPSASCLRRLPPVIALFSLPLIVNLSMTAFYGEASAVRLEIRQVLQIFVIAIVPALVGVFIRGRLPALAERLDRPVKAMATLFLIVVVLAALIGQRGLLVVWGPTVGVVALVFAMGSLLVGYYVPRMLKIERPQAIALAMSIGIHNAALVIALAMSEQMLGNSEMAIPPAAYGADRLLSSAGHSSGFSTGGRSRFRLRECLAGCHGTCLKPREIRPSLASARRCALQSKISIKSIVL